MDKLTDRVNRRREGTPGTRSLKGIFRAPKSNVTIENHPELYYKQMWIDKQQYEAIEFLAKVNGVSRKQMLHEMLELGIGLYLATGVRGEYFEVVAKHWAKWARDRRGSTFQGPDRGKNEREE